MHNPYIFPMFFLIFIFILNSPEVASGIAVKHLFLYWVFTMLWGHWEVLIFLRSGGKTSRDERVFIRRPSPPPPPACLSVCDVGVCASRPWGWASSPVLNSWHASKWISENRECAICDTRAGFEVSSWWVQNVSVEATLQVSGGQYRSKGDGLDSSVGLQ